MSLSILGPLVVVGILGIALLTHWLGLSRPLTFSSKDQARAAWLREFSDSDIKHVTLCQSGQAALIETSLGLGIVWAIGADSTTRYLRGARVSLSATGLTLVLPDFSAPHIPLTLTPDEAAHWAQHIRAAA